MVPLPKAKQVATHFAPDGDGVFATAMAGTRYRHIPMLPAIFLPAGDLSLEEVKRHESAGTVFFDVGGELAGRDHHGGKEKISATRLVAREIGLTDVRLRSLLDFVDANDQSGKNFRFQIANGSEVHEAGDLLVNSIIRGASNVRFSPFKQTITNEQRVKSFQRLVRLATLVIHRLGMADRGASFSHDARVLLQHSLVQAIARTLELPEPQRFDNFQSLLRYIDRLHVRKYGEEARDYSCREDLMFSPYIQMMSVEPLKLIILDGNKQPVTNPDDRWLAESLTLFGISQQLVVEEKIPLPIKLAILKDCWLNLFAYQADWLLALSDLANGGVQYNQEVKGWRVMAIASDCARIGPASRHKCQQNPFKASVTIAIRPSGHVQITCVPQRHLVAKIKAAGVELRRAEAAKRGLTVTSAELQLEEKLSVFWYTAPFGGLFNGSLTQPLVEPTKLSLSEIFQIVCQALAA